MLWRELVTTMGVIIELLQNDIIRMMSMSSWLKCLGNRPSLAMDLINFVRALSQYDKTTSNKTPRTVDVKTSAITFFLVTSGDLCKSQFAPTTSGGCTIKTSDITTALFFNFFDENVSKCIQTEFEKLLLWYNKCQIINVPISNFQDV